jgi:glycosyltransferase involved in cell wall biosynthesis
LDNYLVSLIVASKDPPIPLLELCLASFSSLSNAHRIQLVIVQSGSLPSLQPKMLSRFADTKIIDVPPKGIYAAYNEGIQAATGTYLVFFGVDDIALPGMDVVIERLAASSAPYHLFAAACYMQSVGMAKPSKWRASLAFRNWCHQGIFYSRSYLVEHPYEPRYKAQADHKKNIEIVSNRAHRVGVSEELVAYFSAGGVSSLSPDLEFRREFPKLVARAYGMPFGILVKIKQLLIDSILGDPASRFAARTRK